MASFYERFVQRSQRFTPFCFGIDPTPQILNQWQLPDNAAGLQAFNELIIPAAKQCTLVKPQAAFYELFGSQGVALLESLIQELRAVGVLVLLDAKRGDISHSMLAYTQACLDTYQADAMTVTAYLGINALKSSFEYAATREKSIFVVVRSSNPEGKILQSSINADGIDVATQLAESITQFNQRTDVVCGPVAAVIGATLAKDELQILDALPNALLLTPGIGAQGAKIADLKQNFGTHFQRVIPTSSRAILEAGPAVEDLMAAVKAQQALLS